MEVLVLVEGKLDADVLGAVLQGICSVRAAGSKDQLAARARTLAEERPKGPRVFYVRDRDFDYRPPTDTEAPSVDRRWENADVLGWRWARHSIENYMLDPAIVAKATGLDSSSLGSELVRKARVIRHYQAARFAVAAARAQLPPRHRLATAPGEVEDHEFRLPLRMDDAAMREWCVRQVGTFRESLAPSLEDSFVTGRYCKHLGTFSDEFVGDATRPLVWFSGKDLFAALAEWLSGRGLSPGSLRARVRDFMQRNLATVLETFPEWNALRESLREVRGE